MQSGQLNLQLAFVAARALAKNLKDQQCSVIHRKFKVPLKVALLRWAQGLVKQNFGCAQLLGQHFNFVCLAASDEQSSIGSSALASYFVGGLKSGGLGQQAQLFQITIKVWRPEIYPYQNGERFYRCKQVGTAQLAAAESASPSAVEKLTARPGTMVEIACL